MGRVGRDRTGQGRAGAKAGYSRGEVRWVRKRDGWGEMGKSESEEGEKDHER